MKLSKAVTLFIESLKVSKSTSTVTAYESDLNRFRFHVPMDTVLHVTPDTIRRFLAASSAEGNSMATMHRKLATLRSFCRWGMKPEVALWSKNPVDGIDSIRRPRHLPRPFTDEEVERLMALELVPREAIARMLLFYTGLRVTPLCELKIGDISFAPPTLRALVKGAKAQIIKLHPFLAEALKQYVLKHTDTKAWTFVLAGRTERNPRRREIERMTARWGAKAGVLACTPHRFRHTFATRLLRSVPDLRIVQQALGHADISSTAIYTQVVDQREADAIAQMRWPT